jgi:membrane associated rhomboid family serine protease
MAENPDSGGGQPARDLRGDLGISSTFHRESDRVLSSIAWVTPLIVAANALAFIAMEVKLGPALGFDPIQLASWGGNSGELDLAGQWWRLLTYQFLHGNVLHIAVNMWLLWVVGRLTERLYGSVTYLLLYLGSGALAGLASIVWVPGQISVGASGSIFGVLGAFLAFLLRYRNEVPLSVLRYWPPALLFVGYNLYDGAYQPGIDNACHVGGLIAGFVLGLAAARPLDVRRFLPLKQILAATALAGALALPPLWYLGAFDRHRSMVEEFAATHDWYISRETQNLQQWQAMSVRASAGELTLDDARTLIERDILPFWKEADARLQDELKQPGPSLLLLHMAQFAKLRHLWAQALVTASKDSTSQNIQAVFDYAKQTNLEQASLDRVKLRDEAESLPVPLSESTIAIWIRSRLPGLALQCVNPPAAVEPSPSPGDAAGDGPAQRHEAGCAAQRMFLTGDYATLDATMAKYARDLSDLPDGSSRLEGIWNGLDDLFTYGRVTVLEGLRRASEWRRSVKGSVEPDLLEALILRVWAYAARGHGPAATVTPQAMQMFLARSAVAQAGLHDIVPSTVNDPEWYALSVGVGRDQSAPIEEQRALFDRGAARFPFYLPLYRQMLISLLPRWGGSTQAVDRFIRDMSAKDGKVDPATYARFYLIYGDLEGGDYDVAANQEADPGLLTKGVEALLRRYPGSDYVLNSVARFACIDNWDFFYRQLRPQLDGHPSATAWPDKVSIDSCDKRSK